MTPATRSLASAAIAAAMMYWFDPESGPRRRAMLRDRLSGSRMSLSRMRQQFGRQQFSHSDQSTMGADAGSSFSESGLSGQEQGDQGRIPQRFQKLLQENWSPGARMVSGASGGALLLGGLRQGGLIGLLTALAGGALILRSATNQPLRQLTSRTGKRGIDVRKTLHVNAPVDRVFETLAHYENFPAFMRNIRDVRVFEDGRSHWVVAGPAGTTVEWDAETTEYRPNELLAWRTMEGSTVEHSGIIRFQPTERGTHLDIQMSYVPPAGTAGHVIARMFGADPKSEMDEDLQRMKTYIETGSVPPDDMRQQESPSRGIH